MTITQLEYIVALNEYKSFSKAANFCCVTQPSLSMQIQKLEEELNLIIFNRKIKPIKPTNEGLQIINAARKIIQEKKSIQQIISLTFCSHFLRNTKIVLTLIQ